MKLGSWTAVCGVALYLLTQPLTAGQFEDGLSAHQRGDYTMAMRIWKRLAEKDHPAALYHLAGMYAEGQGVLRDDAAAANWYRKAAVRGYVPAQSALGRLYDKGQGVPQSLSKAMKWYRLAAQKGDVTAQLNLALIYDAGRGVPQNAFQAVKWYRLAADQDDITAQNNLGLLHADGRGVPQDYVQGHAWLSLAAAGGHANAAASRDAISAKMTPEQLDQAEKLARDWMLVRQLDKAAKCRISDLQNCE